MSEEGQNQRQGPETAQSGYTHTAGALFDHLLDQFQRSGLDPQELADDLDLIDELVLRWVREVEEVAYVASQHREALAYPLANAAISLAEARDHSPRNVLATDHAQHARRQCVASVLDAMRSAYSLTHYAARKFAPLWRAEAHVCGRVVERVIIPALTEAGACAMAEEVFAGVGVGEQHGAYTIEAYRVSTSAPEAA